MKKTILIYGLFVLLFGHSTCLHAQSDTLSKSLITQYSLEELINLKISSAEKHEQKIEDVTANVEILTKHEIELLGYKTLHEILQNITGFYHIEDHYWLGSKNYGVRGYFKNGPFSNVAILINGVNQISDKYSDFPDVKITLPIEAIERIEIIKGPMAIMHGNSAFFGIINIITAADTENEKNMNHFGVTVSENLGHRLAFHLANKIDDLQYKLIIGGVQDPGEVVPYKSMTSNTGLISYVGLEEDASTEGHLDYSDIYTGMQIKYKEFNLNLSYNESNKGVFDASPAFNNGNNLNTQATNIMLEYRNNISPNLELALALNYFNHNHLLNYELFDEYYYEIDYQKTNSYFLESHLKWNPHKNLSVLSGVSRRTVTNILQLSDFAYYGLKYGDGKSGLPNGEQYSTHSIYTELQFKPLQNITIYGGFRLEHLQPYDMYYRRGVVSEDSTENSPLSAITMIESTYFPQNNGISFVPRIAVIFKTAENQFLKLLYSEAKKYPSFTENYRQLPENRPQLNPSSIKTLELNYYSYAIPKMVINTSLFYNHIDDIIEATNIYDNESGQWEIYSSNSGRKKTLGLEAQIKYHPSENLSFKLSGTLQKTNDLRENYQNVITAYSPNLLGYFNFMYSMKKNLSIGGNLRYVGGMETSWLYDPINNTGRRLAASTEPYTIIDLNFRKVFVDLGNTYLNFNINNLLNKKYRYPTTKSNAWIDYGVPGEKRHFNLSIGINF